MRVDANPFDVFEALQLRVDRLACDLEYLSNATANWN